ncbi:MAG TPA: SAM-dependent methyltransferase [Actinomycetota bacterium]|jgi:SAM-dependent MidA family methyltransferase
MHDPREAIAAAIEDHGPIAFAEFMELALYGPGGFYATPPVGAGEQAAFVTSPHVHPIFGRLLGNAIREFWDLLGRPDPFRMSEIGAGDGTLARQLLEVLSDLPIRYTAIERSPGARDALASLEGIDVAEELSGEPHVALANELLDNLPFRRFRGDAEVFVGMDGDRFVEVVADGATYEDTVVPEGSLAFLDRLAAVLAPGYALLIDYGSAGVPGGPAHGYAAQRVVEDLLANPGRSDITVGVDFDLVERRATSLGLAVLGNVSQHDALRGLGFEAWTREELSRQARQLDERKGLDAVRTWSGRSRATILVDPVALGRHRWLVLGTTGLQAPSWLSG